MRASARIVIAAVVAALGLSPLRAAAADCSVQVRSVVFGAQSSAHDFVSYAVRLNGEPQTGTNAELSLKLSDGSSAKLPWSDVTIEKPAYKGDVPTAFGTFDRRKADVVAASVDAVSPAHGQSPAPCDGQQVELNAEDNAPWGFEVLNAQKHSFNTSVVNVPIDHHNFTDADFKNRVEPTFPPAERDAGVQGDVTIRITVAPDGQTSRAVVWESSQDDDIDLAALDAAQRSTFKPATRDGVAISQDYLIIYTFRVDGGAAPAEPKCPLTVSKMTLVNAGPKGGPDWYAMDFDAKRTDIVSATVEFYDAGLAFVIVPWDSITVPPLGKDGYAGITATMPWTGDDPLKFWVASVRYTDGHQDECNAYYQLIDRPDAAGTLPRVLKYPMPTVRVETRRYEAPLVESYATYPPASLAADVTGDVGVDVVVGDAGNATAALVVSSSKSADLDNAALSAAMKTKFAPRHDASYFPMRVFYLDYDFEDNIQ